MLNLLSDYIRSSLPDTGALATNSNLCKKVGEDGQFLPFYGNTVVFLLEETTKCALREIQDRLYREAGDLLSRKLDSETFHMTLHDLVNGTEPDAVLLRRIEETKEKVIPLLETWRSLPPLRMKATWIFNMVNTSVVLGLAPGDGVGWAQLDAMYTALEEVVPLGYGLTPHITLAYFLPGIYDQQALGGLRKALRPVELELELRMEDLAYQTFTDMNHYRKG